LGRLWHYLNPILFGLIYFIFIGIVSGGGLNDVERLALIVGNLYVWVFFSSVITTGTTSVSSGTAGITAQSSIPRVILPIASMLSAGNLFVRSMLAYIPFHLLAGRGLYVEMLWAPLLVLLMGVFALGIALVLAVLNIYVRDVSRLLPHLIRLWLYLSPVVWAYDLVLGEGSLEWFARLNPMYPAIAAWTMALGGSLTSGSPTIVSELLVFSLWALGAASIGFLIFVSREDEFAIRS
jgi:teichoic acid transport system permease protein